MPSKSDKPPRGNFLVRLHPIQRISINLALGIIVYFLARTSVESESVLLMLAWDVFALSYLILAWIVLCTRNTSQMRELARKEDNSKVVISILIIVASFASMFMVLLLILSKHVFGGRTFALSVAVTGVLLSWILVHTIFAFHYASMYYDDDESDSSRHAAGLEFPKENHPDYLDFAYFSFVIGMTFQVSDVEISSRRIRRQALVHALLAFALNTIVVALTINVVAGLRG
jgi:uncharacterized membrane protein